jgi:hypothetical protein
MAFVDQHQHSALQDLEKQVLVRATHLDAKRCEASSHVRQDVRSVLESNGHTTSVEQQKGFKAPAAAAPPSASKPPHDSTGGWLCLAASHSSHTADAPARTTVVQIYDKPDFFDSIPPADAFPGAGSVSSCTAASLGIGPRILNVRWRIWEEQIKVKYDVCVLPLAADIWQECVEDAAQEVSLRNEEVGAYQRAPARSAFLKQLLQEAASSTLSCSSSALAHADASGGEKGAETHEPLERALAARAANGEGQSDAHLDSFSPGSMGGDSDGGGGDSSKDNDMEEEDEHAEGAGAGGGGAGAAGEDEKGTGKKLRSKEPKGMPRSSSRREKREKKQKGENGKKKRLWKIEFSQSKQRWYYFNSKTRERLWKAPDVPGWIIKSGSGKHRPYVGLKHYYYNTETGKSSYEPPVDRER